VTLKNFKGHSDRHFTFQPGTNAICGENGAGKTSILEAIAWVLFNHRGAYKTEDLIRNGAATAQATVSFVSNRDQRTYQVSRCTRTGYTIFDPQIGVKLDYSLIEEEVLPWLRQQFGVSPGTDLADLFANTIGVPQGLFTADFLKPERERKKTFDTILKVEEYQKTYQEFSSLGKFAEQVVKDLQTAIARDEADLQDLDALQQRQQDQQQEIAQVEADLRQASAAVAQWQQQLDTLSAQATQLQHLQQQLEQLQSRRETQTSLVTRLQADLTQAEQAAAICTHHRPAYQTVLQAEETLKQLEQQRRAEQQLQQEKRRQEKQLGDRQTQVATLTHQLDRLQAHQQTIAQLQPLIQQQIELEQQQQQVNQQLQSCQANRQTLTQQEKRLKQLQKRQTQLEQDITSLRLLADSVTQIPDLEQQQQRLQQQLSRIAAAVQFEADLSTLVDNLRQGGDRYQSQLQQTVVTLTELQDSVPLWTEALQLALTTLHSGADWQTQVLSNLEGILADLSQQTDAARLETQLQTLTTDLQMARQQQITFAGLEPLMQQQQDLQQEIADLQAIQAVQQTHLEQEPALQTQQQALIAALQTLEDPRGRSRLLQQELAELPQLQTQLADRQSGLTTLQQAIADLDQQLTAFADLPEQIATQQQLREQHRPAYEEYLSYRELANTRKERQAQFDGAIAQQQSLEQQIQQLTEERDRLRQHFDPQEFQQVQTAYQTAQTQQIALSARLPELHRYLENLNQQLAHLQTIQQRCQQATVELQQKQTIDKFIKFARKAYKDAGPRITERYVHSISREADKLFRELLNRTNVSLEWTRNYEIIVQEGAHSRRFVNLSGGEQMCAALAVRLALLKVLADIDIAFFDEPTTNMDRPRRQHLAEAIANIKTFRQLFVIEFRLNGNFRYQWRLPGRITLYP